MRIKSPPLKTIDAKMLADARDKAALQLIDERVGKKRDGKLTAEDLQTATVEFDCDKGPFTDLSSFERDLVREKLPMLIADFGRLSTPDDQVFATSLATAAIINPELRACAEQVSAKFGNGGAEVNLTEFRAAKAAVQKGELPEGVDASVMTLDRLNQLEVFLITGKGDVVTHRGLNINGIKFDEAFPLPGEATLENVTKLEEQLRTTGYDRIYFKGPDEKLYLALDITNQPRVQPGMRVQMGDAEQYRDSGTVIAVRDVSNTFREATIEFWTDVCSNTVNSIRGKLHTNLDTNVTQAGNAATGDVSGLKTALVAGGLAASVGATTLVGFEALAPALAVVAGGLTLFNVVDYARTKNRLDKAPVYHAIGVTLNEYERVR